MEPVIIFALIAGALGIGFKVVGQAAKQRTAALRETADRLGWRFHETVDFKSIPDLDRFELFGTGRSKKLRNLLTSPASDARAVVFDYSYVTGGGNSQRRHRQTVFYATNDALRLPSFSLRPERFYHRVAGAFGYHDINFEDRPEFSRLFLLRGEDEASIRAAFNDAVADFFEQRPGTCAAGVGRELLFWRPGRAASPESIEELVREGYELAACFSPDARHS